MSTTALRSRVVASAALALSVVRTAWLPIALEIGARLLRLPVFPGFAVLFDFDAARETSHESTLARLGRRAALAVVLAGIEIGFDGVRAWEFVAAAFVGAIAITSIRSSTRRFGAFVGVCTVAWSLFGLATGHFPIGASDLEVFLTALSMRLARHEIAAGVLSRMLLAALVYGSIALVASLQRRGHRFAPMLFVLLAACGRPAERTYFDPAAFLDAGEIQHIDPTTPESPGPHPVFPLEVATNAFCLGCHPTRLGSGDASRVHMGFHEIHYRQSSFDRPCVFCHESVGRPGSPGAYPERAARREYNQRCSSCHSDDAGRPYFRGAFQ